MLRHTISASTLCLLLASASPAMGQPAPEAPISAAQMLARLAPLGNIQAKVFPRETGERSLRIYLSVPAGKAPEQGWPVLYMLDGNATLLAVADAIAHARGAPNGSPSIPPGLQPGDADLATRAVLVAIGYDIDARLDVETRSWDYTPTPPGAGAQGGVDLMRPTRRNGGADALLDTIEHQIMPWVRTLAPVNEHRRLLYGHSYGGLFTLYALTQRPSLFQHYIAASPSLWWHAPYMEDRLKAAFGQAGCKPGGLALDLMAGSEEKLRQQPDRHAPRTDVRALAQALASHQCLRVRYTAFEGLGHGPMLPASALAAVRIAGGLPPVGEPGADAEK